MSFDVGAGLLLLAIVMVEIVVMLLIFRHESKHAKADQEDDE